MKRSTSFALVLISMSLFDMSASAASNGGQAAVKLLNASARLSQSILPDRFSVLCVPLM